MIINAGAPSGPMKINPTGLYPLHPFTQPLGGQLPVFTSPHCWEEVLSADPIGILRAMYDAIARAMVSDRADRPEIEFRAWLPKVGEQRKDKRVRLLAKLYQMTENEQTWIELKRAPERSLRGRSAA